MTTALVTGAGGFIGGHLVRALLDEGLEVRAVDVKAVGDWHQAHDGAENRGRRDLSSYEECHAAAHGAGEVYHLACDMGGMGFIEHNKAACMLNVLNSTNMLRAARAQGAGRYFYASTACVYADRYQGTSAPRPLREDQEVYPAAPEDGYGWEKLFGERMCRHFREDYGLETRVGRYHSVYGPVGTWDGGREKVPAALCRKVATAKLAGADHIDIWGDGQQSRSFLYVSDAVRGTLALARSGCAEPRNIGSDDLITVNDLARAVMTIAGHPVPIRHVPGPLGVRGRVSDNTLVRRDTGWSPAVPLLEGLRKTYEWIEDQVKSSL